MCQFTLFKNNVKFVKPIDRARGRMRFLFTNLIKRDSVISQQRVIKRDTWTSAHFNCTDIFCFIVFVIISSQM